ncbi:hypothetical protein NUSPORA_01176 [Nucleospora cyclopteri]
MLDYLQLIKNNPDCVRFEEDCLYINDKRFGYEQMVTFKQINKEYSIAAVAIMLKNVDAPHLNYIEICSEKGIKPVGLVDKQEILTEIENFVPVNIKGSFYYPVYSTGRSYQIPQLYEENYVLLSRDFTNKVNLSNVESFLKDSILEKPSSYSTLQKSKTFTIENYKFVAYNVFLNFTEADWNKVKIVFVDGFDFNSIGNKTVINKLQKNAVLISFNQENNGFFKPVIENKDFTNKNELWIRLSEILN